MKLWFYKCQRRFPPENDGCFPPVPPILLLYTQYQLLNYSTTISHGVSHPPPSRSAGIWTDRHVWTVRKWLRAYLFDIQTRLLQGLDPVCVITIQEWTCEEMMAKLWVLSCLPIFCFSSDCTLIITSQDLISDPISPTTTELMLLEDNHCNWHITHLLFVVSFKPREHQLNILHKQGSLYWQLSDREWKDYPS